MESVTCDGRTIPAEGVFILRPTMAPTELFPGLAVEQGYVTVDRRMATNLPGLFAAGDCTGGPLQVSKAREMADRRAECGGLGGGSGAPGKTELNVQHQI